MQFTPEDSAKTFRMHFIDSQADDDFMVVDMDPTGFLTNNPLAYDLNRTNIQLRVVPKNASIDDVRLTDRISIALECALGFFDEHTAWQHDVGTTIRSRGLYKSHSSTRKTAVIGEQEAMILRNVLEYTPSDHLPEHKYLTLTALLNAARHQAGASDVACVLYFSILESIFVDDNKELGYKLSMRITKKKGESLMFARKISKLYSKRGKVIHGSQKGDVFDHEECILIESLAKDSLVDFLNNPADYTAASLDTFLLG